MAKDAAIVTSWGTPVAGREAKSLEVFMEFTTFIAKRAAEGKCSEAEPYFAADGSGGFAVVRGKSDALVEIWESEENLNLLAKAQLLVHDLKSHYYFTGQEIINETQRFAQVVNDMGLA
jgi:hypothetical protein